MQQSEDPRFDFSDFVEPDPEGGGEASFNPGRVPFDPEWAPLEMGDGDVAGAGVLGSESSELKAPERSVSEVPAPRFFDPDPRLLALYDPRSPATEQYRTIRTNLLALHSESPPRAIVITSATKGEGKTVTASNLAVVLAEIPETRVLIVDCDLRNPSVHRMLGVEKGPGLAELLRSQIRLDEAIQPSNVPGVDLVRAGSMEEAPFELFASGSLRGWLPELRAAYDFILFDTPPVFALTDAAVVGAQCDGVLLVVRRHGPPRDVVERAVHSLRSARSNLLGCLMTGVAPDRKYGRYPYADEEPES